MTSCECEHVAHFGDEIGSPHPDHEYGAIFPHTSTSSVKTTWGTFQMCEECKKAYEQYEREEEQLRDELLRNTM